MAAEISPRIHLEGRTALQDVIPLESPFLVFIDPSNICNFKCTFCPTGNEKLLQKTARKKNVMTLKIFKKIIDDIGHFPNKLKVLRLYKDGEPFLNPNLEKMVEYAKKNSNIQRVETTTNGSLLTPKRSKAIINAGIDQINISLDGMSNEQFLKFTKTKIDFNSFVKNIEYLYNNKKNCTILIKTVQDILTKETEKKFYDTFSPIADKIYVERIVPVWPEFDAGHNSKNGEVGLFGQPLNKIDVCPFIFYSMAINSNGSVSLCLFDWKHQMIIGDVKTTTLLDIWNSKKLNEFQKKFLNGKRENIIFCRHCEQIIYCTVDNIDPYKKEIMHRLKKKKLLT
ncbi:radical SAM/SPASM domain-containing protein [Maridesulfovibrio ferrireducens]|uniref:radical SAM/SPASM domain-containing protein n=1 Tax=Maridesulfovibrio ferrireducens TaxID=246191 RepID=UPI001A3573B8|nr:radical SAM/SPASM domain-containing protein [Maridesulfovibrio ferrireducens]MBI9113155.1 radical SAM protein [Maridesulfovibrio ferrireducens]